MRKVESLQKAPFPAPDTITKVVPAPTEGMDAISPLSSMDPKRAPILTNWIPRPGWIELRAGYTGWVRKMTDSPVETLMVYRPPGNAEEMFAAAGTNIYDVSTYGAYSSVVSGLSSARWQYSSFTPPAGTTVIQCVNGVDSLRQYNGTAWSTPAITGLPNAATTASIVNIYAQKSRLWYVLKDTTIIAFMPTGAITGAIAGYLDFGQLWSKGGWLVAMADWTIDGGSGPQDYAVFLSSRGQISIYAGGDPTNAANWNLVGTFDISPPISYRCCTRVGSDVAVITLQGVLPLSQALPFDPSADRSVAITARIQNAMAQAITQARNNFGWQVLGFPAEQLAILNVPLTENVQQIQYVMCALTGAWCEIDGWSANCFEIFNEDLYFGSNDGSVNKAFDSGTDFDQPIMADMQCAFNYFDDPGRLKRVTMVQPQMVASGSITPTISVDEDFNTATTSAPISILRGGALWDFSSWDIALWPENTVVVQPWLSVDAIGHALAIRMQVNVQAATTVVIGGFDIGEFDAATFNSESSAGAASILQVNSFNTILELGGFI